MGARSRRARDRRAHADDEVRWGPVVMTRAELDLFTADLNAADTRVALMVREAAAGLPDGSSLAELHAAVMAAAEGEG